MGTNPHHTSSAGSWTPGASSPLPAEPHSAHSSAVSVASRQAHPSATGSPGRAGEPEPAASASPTRPSSGGSTVPSSPGRRVLGFIHMQLLLQSLKILIMSHSLCGPNIVPTSYEPQYGMQTIKWCTCNFNESHLEMFSALSARFLKHLNNKGIWQQIQGQCWMYRPLLIRDRNVNTDVTAALWVQTSCYKQVKG